MVFHSPGSMPETPKELEQKRRDKGANQDSGHECTEFQGDTAIPAKWRSLLACRRCKQSSYHIFPPKCLPLHQAFLVLNKTLYAIQLRQHTLLHLMVRNSYARVFGAMQKRQTYECGFTVFTLLVPESYYSHQTQMHIMLD